MGIWSKDIFAKNLRMYMEKEGKNQKELAEIVGVSAPTMNDWIKGKKFPRIDKIEMLADYFGILKSDLIEDKTDKQREQDRRYAMLNLKEKNLLVKFNCLPPEKQTLIMQLIEQM